MSRKEETVEQLLDSQELMCEVTRLGENLHKAQQKANTAV